MGQPVPLYCWLRACVYAWGVSCPMDFNKLDDTDFPILDTVDVYAYKNDYDFKRFDNAQMTIHILNVPWDMGEAHVGQRTITGIGNVVKFENDEARDNWFKSKRYAETPQQYETGQFDGFKWVTKYREFHNGEDLKIPLPFDVVARFNYCWIEYEPAASPEYPVNYEYNGITKWFYFIRNFQWSAVNTTLATIKRDTWQTYINHITFKGAMLEQGHYPFTLTNVDSYLNNPAANNSGLLAEDFVCGELSLVKHNSAIVLNDTNMLAVIVASGNPRANWGSKANNTWSTPDGYRTQDGQPSFYAFAMPAADLNTFVTNINSNTPQFIQTVQCVFFIASKLVTLSTSLEFGGVTCNYLAQKNAQLDLLTLAKEQFGYDNKYKHLVKLYTYPYAALEITNELGETTLVKIEDTTGQLALQTSISLAYPWVTIDGRLKGIGGSSSRTLTFRNVNSHSFNFSGKWYEHLREWRVPTYAITQAASVVNGYSTHFDRLQQANDASTQKANALDSNSTQYRNALNANDTQYTNALITSATQQTNANATADMSITNTAVQNATNSYNNSISNEAITNNSRQDVFLNGDNTYISNTVTAQTTNNEVDAAYNSAAISGIGGVLGSAANGAVGGAALGPVGIAGGAIAGAVGGVIGGITGQMQAAVSNNLLESQAGVQIEANNAGLNASDHRIMTKTGYQTNLNTLTTDSNNQNNTTQTANNAGLMKANAARDKTAADSIAANEKGTADTNAANEKSTADTIANRDYSNSIEAISNQIKQTALDSPEIFGSFSNGDYSTTRPMAVIANVVTQNKDAIERTGDYFLRYGYAYNKYIELNEFNLMPKFTYWKCSDVWVYGLDMSDEHMDEIRFFLMGGVTVWRDPEYIGTTSIYENV